MKKSTRTTLIALSLSLTGFSQTVKEPVKLPSGGTTVNQASNSKIILLSPADEKLFKDSEGSKPVLFRWTALVPKPKEAVTYRLKVWQLMQGQNSVEAMRSNQPIVTKDVVNITQAAISNLYTGPCKPPYLCDFVWAVEVLNSEGFSIGNSHAGSNSFKFDIENQGPVKAEAGNKGNAGNTGMPTGKSLTREKGTGMSSGKSMDRDPYSGLQTGRSLDKPPFSSHPFNLPVEKITYDAAGNIVEIVLRIKEGAPVPKVVVAGSNQIATDNDPQVKVICKTVYCHNPLHAPGCGWQECN